MFYNIQQTNLIDVHIQLTKKLEAAKEGSDYYYQLNLMKQRLNTIIQTLQQLKPDYNNNTDVTHRLYQLRILMTAQLEKTKELLLEYKKLVEMNLTHEKDKKWLIQSVDKIIDHANYLLSDGLIEHHIKTENAKYALAELFAIDMIPYDHAYDPLVGSDFKGFCFGHMTAWARAVSERGEPDHRMISTDEIVKMQAINTFNEKPVARFPVEDNFQTPLWNLLKQLGKDDIYYINMDVSMKEGKFGHAMGIRVYGNYGIEFQEPAGGIYRFATQQDFVNFMSVYLSLNYSSESEKVKGFSLYKTPYKNCMAYDHFDNKLLTKSKDSNYFTQLAAIGSINNAFKQAKTGNNNLLSHAQAAIKAKSRVVDPAEHPPLLDELVKKIEDEIQRIKDDKANGKKTVDKIDRLSIDLKKYLREVNSHKDFNDQQKACYLFVLMEESLALKRGLNPSKTHSNIETWLFNQMVDREFIDKLRTLLPQKKSFYATKQLTLLADTMVESEKKQKISQDKDVYRPNKSK